jgi:NitT/TauT family transport system ATP-binding protein
MQEHMDTSGDVLVQLQGVSKLFIGHGGQRVVAVDRVNLEIRRGEFVLLVGPSGCGKSTLLRIITGLIPPSSGLVLYRGKPLRGINPYATIVFQSFALYPWLTALGNVELALKARGVPMPERRQQALALLDKVGLDGFENAYPRELSGGMRQKVGFARAMAVEPELLCLDEPFSALDVLSAESLRGELIELWLSRAIPTQAILMVSHNIEEAVFLADRIVIMDKNPGRIIGDIPVTLPHPRHRKDLRFLAMVDQVYATIAGETPKPEVPSVPPTVTHEAMLPHTHAAAIAGLVERVAEEGGRQDLYRLGEELGVEVDEFLPAIEAAEALGFVEVHTGDIHLTPLGQTFADASILTRKEIFRQRVRQIPIIRWIYDRVMEAPDGLVEAQDVLTYLRNFFSDDEAPRQLDTAIDWGRYAELFVYDEVKGRIMREQPVEASVAQGIVS